MTEKNCFILKKNFKNTSGKTSKECVRLNEDLFYSTLLCTSAKSVPQFFERKTRDNYGLIRFDLTGVTDGQTELKDAAKCKLNYNQFITRKLPLN
jgi:hypothetical protein